jgi:chromosomal replication initiator protein
VQLDGRHRFDNYIVGAANRLAVSAARAVAESPGETYNPLYIRAASGLGKTHMLSAIGCHALAVRPALHLDALTLDEFVRQLHVAVSMGEAESFRERFQQTDLLLIDDVQFLTGRRETQAELLGIGKYLQGAGRQIVVTSDRLPGDLSDVDERLLAQFASGLVVEIGPPDYETRVAILGAWCAERAVQFEPGVIEELGHIDFASVRDLQTALNRVIGHQKANGLGAPIEPAVVRALFPERRGHAPSTHAGGNAAEARAANGSAAASAAEPSDDRGAGAGEYLTFLSDVAHVVARHVEPWRKQLGEAAARWRAAGYRTGMLDSALRADADPGVDALVATFERHTERLGMLEAEATAADPDLAGSEIFRDPERLAEAEALVAQGSAYGPTSETPVAWVDEDVTAHDVGALSVVPEDVEPVVDVFFLDDEKVLWDWPEITGRVIEAAR